MSFYFSYFGEGKNTYHLKFQAIEDFNDHGQIDCTDGEIVYHVVVPGSNITLMSRLVTRSNGYKTKPVWIIPQEQDIVKVLKQTVLPINSHVYLVKVPQQNPNGTDIEVSEVYQVLTFMHSQLQLLH